MTNQTEFRAALEHALKHAVAWREDGPKTPVIPTVTANELRAGFDIELPAQGRNGAEVIGMLAQAALPGLVANTHANFFAWVQGGSHPIGVAADLLTSSWGQNAGIYQCTPASAIAEEIAGKWLLVLLSLPAESSVAFTTGATMASFICLAAARSEVLHRVGYDLEQEGLIGAPQIHVFLGKEAHATIHSDLRYLGFGKHNLIEIDVDDQGRMIAADLKAKMATREGPKIVIAQAGHINSGAFDPFTEIMPIAKAHKAWVHVDGAFGLWVRAVPGLAPLAAGLEDADSWTTDGHKWLQVPYDSGFAFVRDEQAHRRAMDITASYLVKHSEDGRNPSSYVPELSRRARGFTVWAVLQALGRDGVAEMVARHCACAKHLAQRLQDVDGVTILNDVVINQVALSFGSDDKTQKVIDLIRAENQNFVLGAVWKGQTILRISVIARQTDLPHIDALAESIIRAWEQVRLDS